MAYGPFPTLLNIHGNYLFTQDFLQNDPTLGLTSEDFQKYFLKVSLRADIKAITVLYFHKWETRNKVFNRKINWDKYSDLNKSLSLIKTNILRVLEN